MGNTTPEAINDVGQLFYFLMAAGAASAMGLFGPILFRRFFSFFAGGVWLLFVYHQFVNFNTDSPHWYMGWLGIVAAVFFFYSPFVRQMGQHKDEDDEEPWDEDFEKWWERRRRIKVEERKK